MTGREEPEEDQKTRGEIKWEDKVRLRRGVGGSCREIEINVGD